MLELQDGIEIIFFYYKISFEIHCSSEHTIYVEKHCMEKTFIVYKTCIMNIYYKYNKSYIGYPRLFYL